MTQQAPDKINVFWFLPTHGDGRYLGTTEGGRPVDLPYLQQVALAADSLGYWWRSGRACSHQPWRRGWRPPSTVYRKVGC